MGKLANSLRDAVRRLAYSTSVDQLKKRGVKQVNVLGLDRIVSLVEEAVRRSLRQKLLTVDSAEVADATKEEFLRLLKSNEDLRRTHDELRAQSERAQQEAEDLRLELQRAEQQLATRLEEAAVDHQARHAEENLEIAAELGVLFKTIAQSGDADLDSLRERVLEIVMHVVDRERQVAIAAFEASRDRDVDLLQRRIRKLSESLDQTERQLQYVAKAKEIDTGIASVYREVQGLDLGDDHYARKRELMRDIFHANLQLQKRTV